MIKKNLVIAAILLVSVFLYNSCQSSGAVRFGNGVVSESSKKDFRTILAAGDVDSALDFLESGVSLTETDAYGETALFTAARYGHTDLIALLLLKGADPKDVNVFGESPLHDLLCPRPCALEARCKARIGHREKSGRSIRPGLRREMQRSSMKICL